MLGAINVIPDRLWRVPYNAQRYPGAPGTTGLDGGANCQLFAYELLRVFGLVLPPFRSSDLWEDTNHTIVVGAPFEPLDLLLFNRTSEAYGAHVAVGLGGDQAIHLSRRMGRPVVWPIGRFHVESDYAVLIGAKRPVRNIS